jgi:hypothetical protein
LTADAVEAEHVLARLRYHEVRKGELEARVKCCGSKRKKWGDRRGFKADSELLSSASGSRAREISNLNHAWSRRIVSRLLGWRCGVVTIKNWPDGMSGYSWPWADFIAKLKYKLSEVGIELVIPEEVLLEKKEIEKAKRSKDKGVVLV